MSTGDDGLYRGDPPVAPHSDCVGFNPAARGVPPPEPEPRPPGPGHVPPGYPPRPPPELQPPPGYGPPPGYTQPPGYSPPPGYGPPPGYTQPPGYGPQGYGHPPAFHRPPTNTMAILALVFAFVFAPVGIVLGVTARKQIRQTGEEGDGLALGGIIAGSIITGISVLLILFWILAFASLTGSYSP